MKKSGDFATTAAITRLVRLSSRYSWPVILGFLLVAIVSVGYFTRHFVITTDSDHNGPIFPNLAGTWRLMVLTSARSPI